MERPHRFFKESPKTHFSELMDELNFILSILEDECERMEDPYIKDAYRRSQIRIDTLKKILDGQPVDRKKLALLLEHERAKGLQEILNYPHIDEITVRP